MAALTAEDDNTNVSGDTDGDLTRIRYKRSLAASDDADLPIPTTGKTFVSWATGPLNPSSFLPLFHQGQANYPRGDVSVEFGQVVKNSCKNLLVEDATEPVPGFVRPFISNETAITARIGPPGGTRGYAGITQGPSWGFAWYMSPTNSTGDDVIIPSIAVERGKTYTFSVQGGVDDGTEKAFHPLYITDSAIGGYLGRTPAERGQETVYAGVADIVRDDDGSVTSFRATTTGPLCDIQSNLTGDTATLPTWDDYFRTLDLSCAQNETIQANAGKLVWTVPDDAPNLLYYQCITHSFLGYKLVVFDEGDVRESRLITENGGGNLEAAVCNVEFNGEERTFAGCRTSLSAGVEVYWTVNEDDGEIETLFRAPTNGGYVSFGWGYGNMVGSNAAVAYVDADGTAVIDDYFLASRSSAGVQPAGNQGFTSTEAAADGNFVAGLFTRKLAVDGLPTIVVGDTPAIWAVGAMPSAATQLVQHDESDSGVIDVSETSGDVNVKGGLLTQAYFITHAALMLVAWLVLTPTAIVVMKHLKGFNPWAFQAHRGLNTLSVVLALSAFIMGLVRGSRSRKVHLGLGIAVVVLAVLQVAGGLLRPHKGASGRMAWYFGHAGLGHTALGLAMANALVGMIIYDAGVGWIVAWGVLVGAYVLAHVVLFLLRGQLPQEAAPAEAAVQEEGEKQA